MKTRLLNLALSAAEAAASSGAGRGRRGILPIRSTSVMSVVPSVKRVNRKMPPAITVPGVGLLLNPSRTSISRVRLVPRTGGLLVCSAPATRLSPSLTAWSVIAAANTMIPTCVSGRGLFFTSTGE